jgi:hypothetical protein
VTLFIATAPRGTRRTLQEFQQLAGWVNWSLNIFPLLKPALSNVYDKMSGKFETHAKIFINQKVVRDLTWFIDKVQHSDGIYIMEALDWNPEEADLTAFTDACLYRMAFFFLDTLHGYQSCLPHSPPKDTIFYFEALAVCAAIHAASRCEPIPHHLIIYTDNTNTVDIFHTLRAKPAYNEILITSIDILICFHITLRVLYVPGADNIIANPLSRFENM